LEGFLKELARNKKFERELIHVNLLEKGIKKGINQWNKKDIKIYK